MMKSLFSVGSAALGLLTYLSMAPSSALCNAQPSMNTETSRALDSTFFNPVLPGWHSDPSCARVGDTFFCATSTFIAFPGLPVYASKDLVNWRLASHAWSRESQLPDVSWNATGQQRGMYAPTLRERDGELFLVCEYLLDDGQGIIGVVFRTSDPFDDAAWSDPVIFHPTKIDPDLFWDDDGKVYVATQGIILQELDLETGELSQPPVQLWNGTGGVWPEGPHIYKRGDWYYLLIAEGGTATDHAVTMARAPAIDGPYEAYEANPVLTNRDTDEYFQTVGHADLFTDTDGNWWGLCLATRSGPEWTHYPMGREAVLFPVSWDDPNEFPVLHGPVVGANDGWPLPPRSRDVPGDGPFNTDPDEYDFAPESAIPRNLMYWRVPREGAISVHPEGGLAIVPGRSNLTGLRTGADHDPVLTGQRGLSFIGRRQTSSTFKFSVELTAEPSVDVDQEAGVTVFLTQVNHIDLSIVKLSGKSTRGNETQLSFRLRSESDGNGQPSFEDIIEPVPAAWHGLPVALQIEAVSTEEYQFSVSSNAESKVIGTASSARVSGGNGSFVGSLVGAFATCNGAGSDADCPSTEPVVFEHWRYTPLTQVIDFDEEVPANWADPI